MKALTLNSTDGLSGVEMAEHATPEPAPGEVRVALKAAALNHRELWIVRGMYPGMQLPATLGADGAGVIDAVGEGVPTSRIGEEVVLYPGLEWGSDPRFPAPDFALLGMPGPGTIAEAICVKSNCAVTKPDHLDFKEAAAMALAGLTAWRGLTTKASLQAGESLLITGVGGGVGAAALDIAVQLGARPYVTSSSPETLEKAESRGAIAGFNYTEEGWRKQLAKTSGGIDVVFDGAPAASFPNYVRSLKMGARVVVYGSTGGPDFQVSAPELFLRNISLIGTNVGNPDEFTAYLAFVAERKFKPVIDKTFSFAEAKDALSFLKKGHSFGKVVIEI